MTVKLTSKRQVTFPKDVCEALDLKPGSRLEIVPSEKPNEWVLRPLRLDPSKLAPLRHLIKKDPGPWDREKFYDSLGPDEYAQLRD